MKRWMLAALLAVMMVCLSGCSAVDEALERIGDDIEASKLGQASASTAQGDWSFVVTLRERATTMFTEAFPEATVSDAAVATRSVEGERVIVTLTYQLDGKTGKYGFDYEKDETGEYVLKRYGGGVDSSDL